MTPLQQYCDRWKDGCGNDICSRRKSLCLGKGTIPCDILLCGEAPGESEDAIGQPFVGPAGQELDRWIKNATVMLDKTPRIAFTNLLACLPREVSGRKAVEPLPGEVRQCSQRLKEFVLLADGFDDGQRWDELVARGEETSGTLNLIVAVGSQARDYLDVKMHGSVRFHRPIPQIHIVHPAHLLRNKEMSTATKRNIIQRQTVILKTAMEEL